MGTSCMAAVSRVIQKMFPKWRCVCVSVTAANESNKKIVLDYEEITPCLHEGSKTWVELLNNPERATTRIDPQSLLQAVRAGVCLRFFLCS